jgi:predicted acetyltransferase
MIAREVPVPLDEKGALAAMMRDYMAAMAAFVPGIDADHRYPDFDRFWTDPATHWPFWLKVDGINAGFALIQFRPDAGRTEMEEFFVVSTLRRQGVGLAAARRLIVRFPGGWQITQRETNTGAIAFWHSVLDGFVSYDETRTDTDALRREQRFNFPSVAP